MSWMRRFPHHVFLSCNAAGDVKFRDFAGYRCHEPGHYNDLAVLVFNPQVCIILGCMSCAILRPTVYEWCSYAGGGRRVDLVQWELVFGVMCHDEWLLIQQEYCCLARMHAHSSSHIFISSVCLCAPCAAGLCDPGPVPSTLWHILIRSPRCLLSLLLVPGGCDVWRLHPLRPLHAIPHFWGLLRVRSGPADVLCLCVSPCWLAPTLLICARVSCGAVVILGCWLCPLGHVALLHRPYDMLHRSGDPCDKLRS